MNANITISIEDAKEIERILSYVSLSGIRQSTLKACEKCIGDAISETLGTITLHRPTEDERIERIRAVLDNEELCADAMVSEIAEIIK